MRNRFVTSMILLAACAAAPAFAAMPHSVAAPVQAVSGGTIPKAFRGVWAAAGTACAPRSDGRLVIDADTLRFSDSTGMVRDRQLDGATRVRIDLSMSGEGQQWRDLAELELLAGGKKLRRTLGENTVTYTRCQGAK